MYATVFNDVPDGNNGFPGVAGYQSRERHRHAEQFHLPAGLDDADGARPGRQRPRHGLPDGHGQLLHQPDVTTVQPVDQYVILGVDNPSQGVTAIASAAVEAVGDVFAG